jgi:hypothetical protein
MPEQQRSSRSAQAQPPLAAERLWVGPTAQRADVQVVAAPYRVCPLGAHIDHQGGPVTALALQLGILLAFVPHVSPVVALTSADFPQHPVQLRCVVCRARAPTPRGPSSAEAGASRR